MNEQIMDQARTAYRSGDFAGAVHMFTAAKDPGEILGEADHLRGNALMRLGRYPEAAQAYGEALKDTSYGKVGALLTNQGKAYTAAGDLARARESFSEATKDASYETPYKAQLGLGDVLLKLGNPTEAGVAFRQAAIDGTNPAPAAALASLGACFIALGRAADAVESYRTASDFAGPADDPRALAAGLGEAYAAAGKPADAVEAFQRATADALYQLTPEQQQAYSLAQDALAAQRSMAPTAAGAALDPLDPLGQSGAFIPDPSDTGFFTLTESEMIQQDRQEQKVRRRRRHTGLKVFLVILVVLIIAAGGLGFAYTRGFGIPSQQDTLTNLFNAVTDGTDTDAYLASGLTDDAKSVITATIPEGATPQIQGMDQSMTQSTATVAVELSRGGTQTYEVSFVRQGLGWVVSNISIDFTDAGTSDAATGTAAAGSADTGTATATDTAATSTEAADTSN
ncbi:MAG: tetratricopeptide repeat protein [Collinsella sp.]|nr:tetratricopeptide repeat protein [Collinsella sp.]